MKPTTTIRVRPVLRSGQYLVFNSGTPPQSMGRVLRIETACTPTSFWCRDLTDSDPLAVPQVIGNGILWKHYRAVSELQAAVLMGRVTVSRTEENDPIFLRGDFLRSIPQLELQEQA